MVIRRAVRGVRTFSSLIHNPLAQSGAARYALADLRPGGGFSLQNDFASLCATFDGYRFNTIFEQLGAASFDIVTAQEIDNLKPRGLYNPVPSIIDFYAKHTLTGRMVPSPKDDASMLDDPDAAMPDGDLWIKSKNPALEEAIGKVWHWSNLQLTKTEYATNCAAYGNCLLIVNEEEGYGDIGKVTIEVCHPAALTDAEFDRVGTLTYARITTREFRRSTTGLAGREAYQMTRTYSNTHFEIWEGEKLVRRYPNPHGFVPVVLTKHTAVTGDLWGLNAFSHALPQIHELCIAASVLGTNILMHQKPRWMIFGAAAPGGDEEIEAMGDMWFFPDGSSADVMIPDLSIQDTYIHINRLLDELEMMFPELQLNSVGSGKRDVSGAGVRGLLSGLIRKGLDARERYEVGLKSALQMAITMGTNLGGTGLNIFDGSIGEDLDFEFHWPDILPMNRLERLRVAAEEKTLELQIVVQEAQIREARKDPSFLMGLIKAPAQGQGGNTPPPASTPDNPAQGTPAQ